mgnify:FL=1
MLGLCMLDLGRLEEAVAAFERALDRAPGGAAAVNLRYELGDANERLGEFESARAWFLACRETAPEHRDVELRLRALARAEPGGRDESTPSLPAKRSKISYL